MPPSSRGLGHFPFTEVTGIRIPLGVIIKTKKAVIGCFFSFFFAYFCIQLLFESEYPKKIKIFNSRTSVNSFITSSGIENFKPA